MRRIIRLLAIALSLSLTTLAFAAPVNINTADAGALAAAMKGVGQKRAEAIVAYRKAHGPFHSVDGLTAIHGIGQATVDKNRENLTTGEPKK